MNTLKKHIKEKKFSSVYLLYGEQQDYLRLLYKDKLKEAIIGEDLSMNYSYYEGKDIDAIEVIDKAKTLPFFSERRLIIIENSDFFEVQNPLADSLESLPESTYMIFIAEKVDKRGKLFKQIKKLGNVTEFKELSNKDLKIFVASLLKEGNKKITGQTADYLIDKIGTDMINIQNEIEKLISYAHESDIISKEDIDAVCIEQTENKIFQMIDAITEKDIDTALSLYYDLLSLKEKPRSILRLLVRHFKILVQVKNLDRIRASSQEIASKAGLHPYFVSKYITQSRKFSVSTLKINLSLCNDAEADFNAGNMDDQLGVEVLIIRFGS